MIIFIYFKTGFATDSGYGRTFSKLPKVTQVPWKLSKQKNNYVLIVSSFNQNRLSLRSNISGGFGHKCRRLPPSRWRCHRKLYRVILIQGIFSATFFNDPTTSWPCKQPKTKIWLAQRFKPRRFENDFFFLWFGPIQQRNWFQISFQCCCWFLCVFVLLRR